MFRYLGCILVVVMALVLVGSLGVILLGALAERLSADPALHLTAFDGVAPVGGPPPCLRAWTEGSKPGRPAGYRWLVMRLEDGWSAWAWISQTGHSWTSGPKGLRTGPHRFVMGLPEVQPRLDLTARATIYAWPQGDPVIWFDAAAIVPACGARFNRGAAPSAPPGQVRILIDVVKTLASGRLPVYLVAADAQGYASARRRLKAYGAPPGPAFWVIPGQERGRLLALKKVWPDVRAAVVCNPTLKDAAARAKVPVQEAPSAEDLPGPAEAAETWRRILETLTARPVGGHNARR